MTPAERAELEGLARAYIDAKRRAAEGGVGSRSMVDEALTPLRQAQWALARSEQVTVFVLAPCGVEDGGRRTEASAGHVLHVSGVAAARLIDAGYAELDGEPPAWWPIGQRRSARPDNHSRSEYLRRPQAAMTS